MINYDDAPYPIRDDLVAAHARYWRQLSEPGTWWTAAERIMIAAEVRQAADCSLCAQRKSALSPHTVAGTHDSCGGLPDPVVELVHGAVSYASRLTEKWYAEITSGELTAEKYVECLATVVFVLSVDRFCHAIGVPLRELPSAIDGEPSRYRPDSAGPDEAWVPMVPLLNIDTPEADLWAAGKTGNVIRALSLVPDEVRTLGYLSAAHYLENHRVRDPTACNGALSRPQMELVAGRVSALNGCFY